MKNIFLSAIIGLVCFSYVSAQDLKVGLYGGLNFNSNSIKHDLLKIDKTETFTAPSFGLIGSYSFNDNFALSLRIGYNSMYEKVFMTDFTMTDYSGNPIGTMKQYGDYKLSFLEISPVLEVNNLLPIKNIYFLVGCELGIPLEKNYDITYTYDKVPANPQPINNYKMDNINMRFAAMLGLGYHLQITDKLSISPEISYRFAMNDISTEYFWNNWKLNQFRISINVQYKL